MWRQMVVTLLCFSLVWLTMPGLALRGQGQTTVQVAQSTQLKLILKTYLSTRTSRMGDSFSAELAEPVVIGNKQVLPGAIGSHDKAVPATISGVVTSLEPAKRFSQFGRKASLMLRFDRIKSGSWEQSLAATLVSVHDPLNPGKAPQPTEEGALQAKENLKGDLLKGGVGAGTGSLLGLIFGSVSKGLIIGVIGGGAAIVAAKGKNVELRPEMGMVIRLDRPLDVQLNTNNAAEKLDP